MGDALLLVFSAAYGGALYRLRGGGFVDLGSTHLARLAWAVPTGAMIGVVAGDWIAGVTAMAALFAGLALIGHGAHANFDARVIREQIRLGKAQAEAVTFWLPVALGAPSDAWSDARLQRYHLAGMTVIGIARAALLLGGLAAIGSPLPLILIAPYALHGAAYWAGWRVGRIGIIGHAEMGEVIFGAAVWVAVVNG